MGKVLPLRFMLRFSAVKMGRAKKCLKINISRFCNAGFGLIISEAGDWL